MPKNQISVAATLMFLDLASRMKSLYSTSEPILGFNSKVIWRWPFLSGNRYGFLFTAAHIFFWASEEKKELSPSQILYNKLEKYLSLFIYKNIYFIDIKFSFFELKIIAKLSMKKSNYSYI